MGSGFLFWAAGQLAAAVQGDGCACMERLYQMLEKFAALYLDALNDLETLVAAHQEIPAGTEPPGDKVEGDAAPDVRPRGTVSSRS